MIELGTLLYVGVVLIIAAFLKGAIGLGFPPIAVPLIATYFPPRDAVAIVSIPNLLLTGLILRRGGATRSEVIALWPLFVFAGIATIGGTQILASVSRNVQEILLGVMLLLFVASQLLPIRMNLEPQQVRRLSPIAGILAGLVQGTTGSSSAIFAPFLLSAGYTKQKFVFLISACFMLVITIQTVSLAALGVYNSQNFLLGTATLPPVLLGLGLGLLVQRRLPQRAFMVFVLIFLLLNGIQLIAKGAGLLA